VVRVNVNTLLDIVMVCLWTTALAMLVSAHA